MREKPDKPSPKSYNQLRTRLMRMLEILLDFGSNENKQTMKRIIKNFDTATLAERALIREQYPLGVEPEDLLTLRVANGEHVRVLEVFTPEAICLLRMHPEILDVLEDEALQIDEVDEAALAQELAEQRIQRAAEAQAEALEAQEMTVDLDEEEEEVLDV